MKPCIRALNALLRASEQCFHTFRQLHKDTAGNIATAIQAACETLHVAGALDGNQKQLRADVRTALSLVEVRVVTPTRLLGDLTCVGQQQRQEHGQFCCCEADVR